jgi:hypothetical protein
LSRAPNINPQIQNICNTPYPGSTPFSPLCVRGVSRRLAQALVNAGFPANRLEQINMIGTMNRPLFDSWTTQLKYRAATCFLCQLCFGKLPLMERSANCIL